MRSKNVHWPFLVFKAFVTIVLLLSPVCAQQRLVIDRRRFTSTRVRCPDSLTGPAKSEREF